MLNRSTDLSDAVIISEHHPEVEKQADWVIDVGHKGDQEGEIAEEREALRLNANDAWAHNNLGIALRHKGDLEEQSPNTVRAYAACSRDQNA